jgi:ribosome maturation factor RimP
VDRLVRIELRDGASLEGRILDVPDDETVEVTVDGERHSVPRADVVRAVVQVEFNRETSVESGD